VSGQRQDKQVKKSVPEAHVAKRGGRPNRSAAGGVDRRTALLNAAVEQIARRGTRGMRIDEVAKAADVSPALVYHHFADRSALLAAALEHIGERADSYTSPRTGSSRDMLLDLLINEVQDEPTVRTNSAAWGELRDTAIFDETLRPTLAGLTTRWINDVADLVRAGHLDGSVDAGLDPIETGVRLTALVEGLSSRWLAGLLDTSQARHHVETGALSLLNAVSGVGESIG
jgi:AcrR family transcriptional regulator